MDHWNPEAYHPQCLWLPARQSLQCKGSLCEQCHATRSSVRFSRDDQPNGRVRKKLKVLTSSLDRSKGAQLRACTSRNEPNSDRERITRVQNTSRSANWPMPERGFGFSISRRVVAGSSPISPAASSARHGRRIGVGSHMRPIGKPKRGAFKPMHTVTSVTGSRRGRSSR